MALRVVRLGSDRVPGEGLRIGTVRRPPRGVPKERWSPDGWFDTWLPELAPSAELVASVQAGAITPRQWEAFARRYRREMARPVPSRIIRLLALLSRQTDLAVGCYCEDEKRCHRSVLGDLLRDSGAAMSIGSQRQPRRPLHSGD